jgi:hypothetical protein
MAVGDVVRVHHVIQDRDVPIGRCLFGTVIYRSAHGGIVRETVRYGHNSREVVRMFEDGSGSPEFHLEHRELLNKWKTAGKARRYE